MVKLKGPGLGKGASGTLAGRLIFSNQKGTSYLKMHAKPKQPNTLPQQGMKAIMAFLSSEWNNLTADQKATWNALAEAQRISPINAYQQANLTRWRQFKAPSMIYPATEAGTNADWASHARDCLGNHVRIKAQTVAPHDGWGVAWFRTGEPAGPDKWSDLVHITHLCGFTHHYYDFYPDQSGTYRVGYLMFTTDGKFNRVAVKYIGLCALTV